MCINGTYEMSSSAEVWYCSTRSDGKVSVRQLLEVRYSCLFHSFSRSSLASGLARRPPVIASRNRHL